MVDVSATNIKTGSPVILTDNSGFEDSGLEVGCKGWANSITHVPGQEGGDFVFFMPEDGKEMYVTFLDRVEYDSSRDGLELNENTIHKD